MGLEALAGMAGRNNTAREASPIIEGCSGGAGADNFAARDGYFSIFTMVKFWMGGSERDG
jgi:hypothetical protein